MNIPRIGTASLCVLAWSALAAPQNLLPDGDFESGFAPWTCNEEKGAVATGSVEAATDAHGAQVAKVVISTPGKANHVQVACALDRALLTPGELYKVSFMARAEPERTLSVHLIGSNKPWGNAGLQELFTAGATWASFERVFRAKEVEQPQVKLDFFLGDMAGAFWFDNVVLTPCEFTRQQVTGPVLETADTKVQFSDKGAIGLVARKAGDLVLAGGLHVPPAYEITLRRGETVTEVASSAAEELTVADVAGGKRFTFRHSDFTVHCSAMPEVETGLVVFGLEIENRGDAAIDAVRYPILNCPAKLGASSKDDAILYPACDGGLIEDPLTAMPGQDLNATYPGPLSCQLMAYYDPAAGLYLATYDGNGCPKRFGCKLGVDLELSITHLLSAAPGTGVKLSYPVVVGTFTGDWYEAAEIYRRWSRQQAWCAKTLRERADVPEWVKKGAIVTCYSPRPVKDGKRRFDPDGLHDFLQSFRDDFGLPVIPNNRGWEPYGEWCGQEYWPPYPDEASFREDARIIREAGGQGMIMLSGYRWTIDKPQPDGSVHSNEDRFQAEVSQFVTYAADGVTPTIRTSEKKDDFHGTKFAQLCPATRFAEDTIVDTARRCAEAGYAVIHFDQEVSGPAAANFCGSRNHGHTPGWGPWMYEAMAKLYQRIRAECTPLNPDFALSMEEPNELFIPWLNICQSRPNGITAEWPAIGSITRMVPLFSYLYHDYVVGWIAFYPWRSGGHPRYTLANGFCAGMMPGLHRESLQRFKPDEAEPFTNMLRNCNRTYAGAGREYLVFGKMLKPLKLDVPVRTLQLGQKFGQTTVLAVSNSVWELPDGRKAVVLVNPETEAREITLPGVGKTVTVPPLDMLVVEF
ncbi:MAG: hypothetical protein A3K19_14330 [Lentisphaerae bacterium RIFOXYB12_FULL_65_16]|nr:MAG: hypothetical protein A3K18_18375 [Lentisphaerae bacterium RIFOXYA12_64_32]OGV87400.1 MAG: hypothetical protein A3K19_14330 [Lentisphaerae bacterium RIFOXYB12_FULL_65_16]